MQTRAVSRTCVRIPGGWYFVILLTLLCAAGRIPSLWTGLPPYTFCDEDIYTQLALRLVQSGRLLNVEEFRSGGLNVYPLILIGYTLKWLGHLNLTALVFAGRLFYDVLMNPLAVPLTYAAGLQLFPSRREVALCAAIGLAVSPMYNGVASIVYPDHFLAVPVSWFLFQLLRCCRGAGSPGDHAWLGVAFGACISTKFTSFALVLPMLAYATWFGLQQGGRTRGGAVRALTTLAFMCGVAFIVFVLCNPGTLRSPKALASGFLFNINNYRRPIATDALIHWTGIEYYFVLLGGVAFGWLGWATCGAGTLRVIRQNLLGAIVVLLPCVALPLALGARSPLTFDRNLILCLPAAALLWGAGASWMFTITNLRNLSIVALLALMAQPALRSANAFSKAWQPDSRVLAAAWIVENVPSTARVAHNEFCSGESPAARHCRNLDYAPIESFDSDCNTSFDYYVFNSWWPGALQTAFRSGLIMETNYPDLHFLNGSDPNPLSRHCASRDPRPIIDSRLFKVEHIFEGSGPTIVVIRRIGAMDSKGISPADFDPKP